MEHHLKILPKHFAPVQAGLKTAELRKNDREFNIGDVIFLHEWAPDLNYSGHFVSRIVMHVADVSDYLPGYVLLSMCGNFNGNGDEETNL